MGNQWQARSVKENVTEGKGRENALSSFRMPFSTFFLLCLPCSPSESRKRLIKDALDLQAVKSAPYMRR